MFSAVADGPSHSMCIFPVQSEKESGLLGSFSEVSLICSVTLGKSLNLTVVQFIHYKISLIILARFAEP